ncbi:MAG TPA: PEP-CTERM sorting domain-containing protein [Bryobacteraceae bacterium]|jgi:hypothetical protein|nr:PEP-CTERM sorting domain-containing protein [Bryobacteraceae bacterium]
MKRYILTSFVLALACGPGAVAGTVYDNTVTDTLNTISYSTGPYAQIGDQVALGGVDRLLNSASIQFYNNGDAGTFSAIPQFWNLGAPVGAQIGGDYQVDGLAIDASSILTVPFSIPNLEAPDSLIVTVAILNTSAGMDLGLDLFDPPVVGSSDNTALIVNDGSFQTSSTPEGLGNLYLGLDATTPDTSAPEPSTGAMLGGLAILALIVRRPSARSAR